MDINSVQTRHVELVIKEVALQNQVLCVLPLKKIRLAMMLNEHPRNPFVLAYVQLKTMQVEAQQAAAKYELEEIRLEIKEVKAQRLALQIG